ncbi:MAG: galactokinase [Bryobacterales bacterium]|nr:galactokinase [Bryobacterales bacterium]
MAVIPNQIVGAFQEHFKTEAVPDVYRAPGRVNLIGEHTDYNLGYVFPIALEMSCYVAILPAAHGQLRIYSSDWNEEFSTLAEGIGSARPVERWSDYVVGVASELAHAGVPSTGADLWIGSNVPVGSGLSSSAALEVSTALALLGGQPFEPLQLARLAQRAESQFVGMPCGIMDQYASVFGQEHSAIQIDCRSLEHEYVPIPDDLRIVAVNSMVKHELGTSAYRERVAECQEAVAALRKTDESIQSLRDVSLAFFERVQESVPLVPRKRARHVISDTQRVLDLAAASRAGDLIEMGRLFIASHRSMQYDYEISCEEIDFLVDTAIKLPGVYGSRVTGGGFGGCTVNLVAPEHVEAFQTALTEAYVARYATRPIFYDCVPAAGAGRVS